MKKNLKICVEQPLYDEPLCLVNVNDCELIERSKMTPDLVHKRSAHISAAWRFADRTEVTVPMRDANLTAYRYLSFSVFSVNGAGATFSVIFESGDDAGYECRLSIAHDGWNEYRIELPFMRAFRTPLGWDQISGIRFDCVFGGQSNRLDTVLYFDSLFVRKNSAPHLYETMPELKGAAVFAKCGNYAIVNRRRVALSMDGEAASPYEENGVWWIPMGAIAAGMAYSAVADNKALTLSFTYRRKKYEFGADRAAVFVNGEAQSLAFSPVARCGTLFFPAEYVRDFFRWRHVFVDPIGLIAFSNRKAIFDRVADADRIWQLVADMTLDRPSGEQIKNDLHKMIKNPGKSRVLMSNEALVALRKLAKTDDTLKDLVAAFKLEYGLKSDRFLSRPTVDASDDALTAAAERLIAFSMLYRVTGDKVYSERTAKEAEALATLSSWGDASMCTTAEVAFGVSIAYDWCHNGWSEARKAIIERAILRNALRPAVEAYNGGQRTWDGGSAVAAEINMGFLAAALALADVYPETTLKIFTRVLRNAEQIMPAFSPDGGFAEGVHAWERAARATAFLVRMLQTACGKDYGFSKLPGFAATAYFPMYSETANGAWNYHNDSATAVDTSALSCYTQITANPVFAWWRRKELLTCKKQVNAYDLLFFVPTEEKDYNLPLDAVYRNAGLAMMRADREGSGMIACLHGGKNNDRDSDLDVGSFILECAGERFICETGGVPSIPTLLRRRAEGQNTVVINPTEEHIPDQNPGACAPLAEMKSSAERVFAILDMSDASDALIRAKRGVMLTENRTVAVVQDEMTMTEASNVLWSIYTPADVRLSASGRAAWLTINEKTMLCKLCGVGYPARFEAAVGESGLTKLFVRIEGKSQLRMAVVFRMAMEGDKLSDKHYELVPMSHWNELDNNAN